MFILYSCRQIFASWSVTFLQDIVITRQILPHDAYSSITDWWPPTATWHACPPCVDDILATSRAPPHQCRLFSLIPFCKIFLWSTYKVMVQSQNPLPCLCGIISILQNSLSQPTCETFLMHTLPNLILPAPPVPGSAPYMGWLTPKLSRCSRMTPNTNVCKAAYIIYWIRSPSSPIFSFPGQPFPITFYTSTFPLQHYKYINKNHTYSSMMCNLNGLIITKKVVIGKSEKSACLLPCPYPSWEGSFGPLCNRKRVLWAGV